METPYNKPRVFLSYSEIDTPFIRRLADDLRKCQIDPWQYSNEVRHGKPWLDSIFRYGMPTCDAIIAYLTESALSSPVVSKEIDAGILQKLRDSNVAFLPYVSNTEIRVQLRPDIQALQTPTWNDDNYSNMLPVVVSEIWRSYLERTISIAINDERLKRTEAELELEKIRSQPDEVFSNSENKEFEFIRNSLNRKIMLFTLIVDKSNVDKYYIFNIELSSAIDRLSEIFDATEYNESKFAREIASTAIQLINRKSRDLAQVRLQEQLKEELLMHGLIEKHAFTSYIDGSEYLEHSFELSQKYFRYRFWLAYNQKITDHVICEFVEERHPDSMP